MEKKMPKSRLRRGLKPAVALVVSALLTLSSAPSGAADDGPQPGAESVSIVMRGGVQVLADVGPYRFGNPPHTGIYRNSIRASVYEGFDTKVAGVDIDIFAGPRHPYDPATKTLLCSITTDAFGDALCHLGPRKLAQLFAAGIYTAYVDTSAHYGVQENLVYCVPPITLLFSCQQL
jgi:hypothetical protein